jgi:predicted amidophosphoribosyltransferase
MFEKKFCEYCGAPLDEHCSCARDKEEWERQFIEDYENDPMTLEGWRQQDVIDMYRFER